ncbi:MAG: hypothetical protein LBU83_13940 [Bacteroidales bacterium]|jgi:hypothetical protein|nr:hypothetical protein [Bacteroidales bacterium]
MVNYFKKNLFIRCLKKHHTYREKKIVSLEQVKTMGLLCQIIDEESYKNIYSLFSKLHSPKRIVWLMGYIDERKVPYYCLQQLSADFFSKKDLNWYGKPDFVQLNDFQEKEFDILVDFSRNDLPPLRYILSTTKAKLLIGSNEYAQDLYDIYIKDEAEINELQLLKIIHNYLLKLTGK